MATEVTRRCKVGVQLHPQHTTIEELRDAWQRADALGVDSIWLWDHFFPLYGDPEGPHFEGMSLLSAMAVTTENADIGLLVACNSYRNPDLLADMACTIDHLSGGRTILGIGSGWFERDYDEYGYDFATAGQRLRDLADALPRINSRLARLQPGPLRRPMPVLIGGSGERVTLRLVAEHATMWNTFGPPENFAAKSAVLDNHCAAIGRNPADIERTVCIGAEDLDRLDEYSAAGAQHMILMLGHPFDLGGVEAVIAYAEG